MLTFILGAWAGVAVSMTVRDWREARDLRGDYFLLFLALCVLWPVSLPLALAGVRVTAKTKGE